MKRRTVLATLSTTWPLWASAVDLPETDDNALIYMHYKGLRHGPDEVMARLAKGEAVDPDSYYFRMAPVFETGSEKYAWINRMLCVATGHRLSTGPVYQVYEVL